MSENNKSDNQKSILEALRKAQLYLLALVAVLYTYCFVIISSGKISPVLIYTAQQSKTLTFVLIFGSLFCTMIKNDLFLRASTILTITTTIYFLATGFETIAHDFNTSGSQIDNVSSQIFDQQALKAYLELAFYFALFTACLISIIRVLKWNFNINKTQIGCSLLLFICSLGMLFSNVNDSAGSFYKARLVILPIELSNLAIVLIAVLLAFSDKIIFWILNAISLFLFTSTFLTYAHLSITSAKFTELTTFVLLVGLLGFTLFQTTKLHPDLNIKNNFPIIKKIFAKYPED